MGNFEFDFIVYAIKTTVDNGIRVSIDLPEGAIETAAILMACKKNGMALHAAVGTPQNKDNKELINFKVI